MGQGVWITWHWNSPRVQGGLLEGRRVLGSSGNGNAGDNDVESNEAHVGSCEEEARNLITTNLNDYCHENENCVYNILVYYLHLNIIYTFGSLGFK